MTSTVAYAIAVEHHLGSGENGPFASRSARRTVPTKAVGTVGVANRIGLLLFSGGVPQLHTRCMRNVMLRKFRGFPWANVPSNRARQLASNIYFRSSGNSSVEVLL